MTILVTGGAGYIGSHTVKELLAQGYDVLVLDNLQKGHLPAVERCQNIVDELGTCTFVQGDLADQTLLTELFSKHTIQAVIHFAADSLVGESMTAPAKYFKINFVMGLNLRNVMVAHQVKSLVFSSTAAVYGEPTAWPITEAFPKVPTNTYGLTKLQFEQILQSYEQAYGFKFMSLRYFNAAGADASGQIGEDHTQETHLIPLVLQTALGQREQITVFGTDYPTPDGTCIRDYIHVTDLAQAHILALRALLAGAASNTYNLGNGNGYSVREVIETARQVTGREIKMVAGERRFGDPAVLVASSERLKAELGWEPQYPKLEDIIRSAWQWHSGHPQGYDE